MERLLPWYITDASFKGWLLSTVLNAITLAALAAGVTAGIRLALRLVAS